MPDTPLMHVAGCPCCADTSTADQSEAAIGSPPTAQYPSGLHRVDELDLRALLYYRGAQTADGVYTYGLARWNADLLGGKGLTYDEARNSDIGVGTPVMINYHFMTAPPAYFEDGGSLGAGSSFRPMNELERKIVIEELTKISNLTGLKFVDSATSDGKTLSFGVTTFTDSRTAALGYVPVGSWSANGVTFSERSGDVYLNRSYAEGLAKDGAPGTIRHEIGHALGLSHPFMGPVVLPDSAQNKLYTALGYTDANDILYGIIDGTSSGTYLYAAMDSLGVLDILALQSLYGRNTSYRSGDDIYSWDQNVGFREVVYDTGGLDTIDLSASTMRSDIDLTAGYLSSINMRVTGAEMRTNLPSYYTVTPPMVTYTGKGNLALLGTIENVRGGAGNDRINGNAVANDISGGVGNDSIWGGAGNDRLFLGAGNDRVVAGAGSNIVDGGTGIDVAGLDGSSSQFRIARGGDGTLTVTRPDGTDTYAGTEFLLFKDGLKLFWNVGAKLAGGFDESYYLSKNPDVAAAVAAKALASGLDHYVRFGQAEGRFAVDARADLYYDENFYLAANPDVAGVVAAGGFRNGWAHYQAFGKAEGRMASPLFDRDYYLSHNADVKAAGTDPWQHFMNYGWREGRDPSAFMDVSAYLDANADLKAAGVNPVAHYAMYGQGEGRLLVATTDVGIDWTYVG